MNTGLALEERERFLSRDARGSVGYRRTGWRDVGQVEVVLQMPVRRRSSCPRQLRQKSGCSRIWLKELRSLRTRSCFLLRFQPFLFCSKALSTQSTHGGERLVDRKRLMRNPRVWIYRQTRTLDFQTQAAGPETRSPGAAAAAAAPWQRLATESLSCLCILGHRLRFDVGIAVSHGHSRDSRPTRSHCQWAAA